MPSLTSRLSALENPSTNKEERFYTDYVELKAVTDALKEAGRRVVLTQGVFDLLHIGHAQYLEKAREHGDVLVVGVDSDELTRLRKGEGRPIVPESERVNMLLHLRHVDVVVLRNAQFRLEELIETIRPNVLIVSESTDDMPRDDRFDAYCDEIKTLAPQSVTSTTARIRTVSMVGADQLAEELSRQIPDIVRSMLEKLKSK